jgi:hypothetical protein
MDLASKLPYVSKVIYMRSIFLLFSSILVSCIGFAQKVGKPVRKGIMPKEIRKTEKKSVFKRDDLNGKWQETMRRVKDGDQVEFTDTLMLTINKDAGEVKSDNSSAMSMKGSVEFEDPDNLVVAGDPFTIKTVSKNSLVLQDEKFIRKMERRSSFAFEHYGKPKIEAETFDSAVAVSSENIKGKWMVYRRKAPPSNAQVNPPLIKSIDIVKVDGNVATGEIVYYTSEKSESVPCTVILGEGSMSIKSSKYTWDLLTYKADGKEFVFGKAGEIVYYARH